MISVRGFKGLDFFADYPNLLLLTFSVFVFGFGTSSSPINKASSVVSFLILATFLIIKRVEAGVYRNGYLIFVSFVSSIVLVVSLNPVLSPPYRIANFASHKIPVQIKGDGFLLFDRTTSYEIRELQKRIIENSYSTDIKVVDISSNWQPGLLYILGLSNPESLVLTIPGYNGTSEVFEHNLEATRRSTNYSESWIFITKENRIQGDFKSGELLKIFSEFSSKNFPADYQLVGSFLDKELWKPRTN
jgi:hypothetical protein